MAPMYDEDESIWTGAGLSKEIARQRLAERQRQAPEVSGMDRAVGAMKGAAGGASTGASLGSFFPGIGTAIGAGVGAVAGGLGGALTASPSEKAPSASQVEQGMSTAKKAYKEAKYPGITQALKETAEDSNLDLADFAEDMGYSG